MEEKRKTSVEQGKPDSTPAAGTQGASPTPSGALSPLTPEKSPSGILSPSGKPPPPPPDSDVPTNDSKAEDDLDVTPKNVSITSLELETTDGGVGETKADSKKLTNGAPFSPSTEVGALINSWVSFQSLRTAFITLHIKVNIFEKYKFVIDWVQWFLILPDGGGWWYVKRVVLAMCMCVCVCVCMCVYVCVYV